MKKNALIVFISLMSTVGASSAFSDSFNITCSLNTTGSGPAISNTLKSSGWMNNQQSGDYSVFASTNPDGSFQSVLLTDTIANATASVFTNTNHVMMDLRTRGQIATMVCDSQKQ